MSYQVFAIKTRPQSFSEVIGQEPIVTALKHALDHNKLHHAYLFTGTRGVGKTTLARIIAKAMNCEKGMSSNPCNSCDTCLSIIQGHFPDLIEIDAASKTKVEDTRALLDSVIYAPTRGKYKIYLIDEVHMLSTHSFNALLKTLEEPPSHVKFLLATTDPQKIPATILSRCLQFTLKWVKPNVITNHLQKILVQDNISFELDALKLIAHASEGSVRDSLSLLEQAVAIGAGSVTQEHVRLMLGRVKGSEILELLHHIIANDTQSLITQIKNLAMVGVDFSEVLTQLIYALHQIAIMQQAPDLSYEEYNDLHPDLKSLTQKISAQDLQIYYQIALLAKRDLPYSPQPRLALEMALMRMASFVPMPPENFNHSASGTPSSSQVSDKVGAPVVTTAERQKTEDVMISQTSNKAVVNQEAEPVNTVNNGLELNANNWHLVLYKFNITGIHLQILKNSMFISFAQDQLSLLIDANFNALVNSKRVVEIEQSISSYLRRDIKVIINSKNDKIDNAVEKNINTPAKIESTLREEKYNNLVVNFQDDPNIKEIIKTFNGELRLDSVELADGL